MLQVITLLVIFGYGSGSPTPVIDQSTALSNTHRNYERVDEGVIKAIESSLDGNDLILKKRLGTAKRIGFLQDNVDQPLINEASFESRIPSFSQGNFHGELRQDPYIGTEEAAARAVNSPLFFDTFDHAHMVMSYAERRQSPLLFRSIRPDFPFSDIRRGDSGRG